MRVPKRKLTCKWCGEPRSSGGMYGVTTGTLRCRNPDCPRKGQVAWQVPHLHDLPRRFDPPFLAGEDNAVFDNAVRAIEDSSSE